MNRPTKSFGGGVVPGRVRYELHGPFRRRNKERRSHRVDLPRGASPFEYLSESGEYQRMERIRER